MLIGRRSILAGLCASLVSPAKAWIGVGGRPSPIDPIVALQNAYVARGWGLLYCWGLPTFQNTEVSQGYPTNSENVFAPTGFDMDQIIAAAVAAKAKYVGWLAKHHDGIALWYTTTTIHGLKETTWYGANGIDPLLQFCIKARAANITPVIYYSVRDATNDGGKPPANVPAFKAFCEAQLTELATNYGSYAAIWLDGAEWWYGSATPWTDATQRNNFIRGLRANTLAVDNSHTTLTSDTDIIVYEGGFPLSGNTVPSEGVGSILTNGNYFWKTSGNTPYSAATLLSNMSTYNSRTASYFLGVPITTAGIVDSTLVSVLTTVGASLP